MASLKKEMNSSSSAQLDDAKEQNPVVVPFPESDSEIRAAVLEWKNSKKRCFDKRPITYMTMTAITPMSALRYILETFVEKRVIGTKSVPFRGQPVTAAEPCPEKWSVSVPPPPAPPAKAVVEFPETSTLQKCPTCKATGKVVCKMCGGHGTNICGACGGMGSRGRYPCLYCGRRGVVNCAVCACQGWLNCPQCEGVAQVVLWNILTVTWKMDVKTFNTARGDLSHELLDQCHWSDVKVSQMSDAKDPRPLEFSTEPEVTTVAEKYVGEMMKQEDIKILSFRQSVTTIPVVKVDYQWKGVVDRFYVYGAGRDVHFPNPYPGSGCGCCCCCGNAPCVIV